jgi:hypothetical protein
LKKNPYTNRQALKEYFRINGFPVPNLIVLPVRHTSLSFTVAYSSSSDIKNSKTDSEPLNPVYFELVEATHSLSKTWLGKI